MLPLSLSSRRAQRSRLTAGGTGGVLGPLLKARDLARPEFKANPYPFYARLRVEEPVCRISAVFMKAWLVTRYEDAVMVLKDPRISKNVSSKLGHVLRFAKPLADNMLSHDPPDHTRLRTLVSKAFTPRRIEQSRSRIQGVCDELLAAARPRDDRISAMVQAEDAGDRLSEESSWACPSSCSSPGTRPP